MKKSVLFFILIIFSICCSVKSEAMVNPWTNCGDDIGLAHNIAGFNFPLRVKNYNVMAMKNMIEIRFPINKIFKKEVIVRKSSTLIGKPNEYGYGDISGVYDKFPVNKDIVAKNGVPYTIRADKRKIYVVNFAAESGYYSVYCKKGLNKGDLKRLYKIIEEAEAQRGNFSEIESYSLEQLADLRRVDDIVEPVYTQDCFPRTLAKKGVSRECFERANLGEDSICSASEIKMIKEYYKRGQDKDPLNDPLNSKNFCAD